MSLINTFSCNPSKDQFTTVVSLRMYTKYIDIKYPPKFFFISIILSHLKHSLEVTHINIDRHTTLLTTEPGKQWQLYVMSWTQQIYIPVNYYLGSSFCWLSQVTRQQPQCEHKQRSSLQWEGEVGKHFTIYLKVMDIVFFVCVMSSNNSKPQ